MEAIASTVEVEAIADTSQDAAQAQYVDASSGKLYRRGESVELAKHDHCEFNTGVADTPCMKAGSCCGSPQCWGRPPSVEEHGHGWYTTGAEETSR